MATAPKKWDLESDLVILGSSGGGLTAAIVGHDAGLKTVVLEKLDKIGGGHAYSGGVIWVPLNSPQQQAGHKDSKQAALQYVRNKSLGLHDEAKLNAYLDNGAEAMTYLEKFTPLTFCVALPSSDYYRHIEGFNWGRVISPDPNIMPPVLEALEKRQPLLSKVQPNSAGAVWKFNLGSNGGRCIMGALTSACVERDIPILTETPARELVSENSRVIGVRGQRNGHDYFVRANRGVLIATGGFEHNAEMNKRYLPFPQPIVAFTPPGNTGDGHIMGMEVGAATALMNFGIMLSGVLDFDGKPAAAAVSATPGLIIVNKDGKRCCNESLYMSIARALGAISSNRDPFWLNHPMYVVMDSKVPGGPDKSWARSAGTIGELAQKIGVNADNMEAAVKRYNEFAKQGKDPDFGRGEYGAYEPNFFSDTPANMGPVEKPLFYAAPLGATTVGTKGGLVTNIHAQVLSVRGDVIPGLYCTSNTAAHTPFGAGYTSGQSNGNSMIFGYVAAKHVASAH